MSTVSYGAPTRPPAPITKTGDRLRKVLLACGPLSALIYIGWHELAALQWEGYSRISNAISELHFTGTPSKSFLDPWQGWVDSALLAAFGIGIWLSAQGSRSLRVIGAVMIVPAAMIPLWMIFGEASIAAHLALVGVGILCWLVAMGFGAAALGKRFRIYSLVSIGLVVGFFALGFSYVPEANAGQPTPFLGLFERIGFSAYFLWLTVLAVALWRRPAIKDRDADLKDRTRAGSVSTSRAAPERTSWSTSTGTTGSMRSTTPT
jgi:hypothetical protein